MKTEQAVSQNPLPFDLQSQARAAWKEQTAKAAAEGVNTGDSGISRMSRTEKNTLSVSERFLISSIEKANKAVLGANTRFEFSIHEGTKEIMVKVLNADTGELIREIPSEKILDIVAGIWQAVGLFVDEKR